VECASGAFAGFDRAGEPLEGVMAGSAVRGCTPRAAGNYVRKPKCCSPAFPADGAATNQAFSAKVRMSVTSKRRTRNRFAW
jgi:hypothetical protein